jgi:hypothetical protein
MAHINITFLLVYRLVDLCAIHLSRIIFNAIKHTHFQKSFQSSKQHDFSKKINCEQMSLASSVKV